MLCSVADCAYSAPLGMISGDIQDWQLSASSSYPQEWDKNCHERYARLYQANGRGWCARYKTSSEWLQVDLGVAAKVSSQYNILCRRKPVRWDKVVCFSGCVECMRCRLLLRTCAASVCQLCGRRVLKSFGTAFAKSLRPLVV